MKSEYIQVRVCLSLYHGMHNEDHGTHCSPEKHLRCNGNPKLFKASEMRTLPINKIKKIKIEHSTCARVLLVIPIFH